MKTAILKSKRFIDHDEDVFDVTVADNHNLFVCDQIKDDPVLVHNCLDENRSALKAFGTPHGGLDQIFQVYGNDHYERAKFGKEDRANSELTRLDNPDFLEYAATDTTSIFNIHLMQMERAAYLELGDKNYRPFFKRLVVTQMSNTVHVLSHMRQYGAAIDKEYLVLLKGRDSPLLSLIDTAELKNA